MTFLSILGGLAVLGIYGHFSTPPWRSWGPGPPTSKTPRPPSLCDWRSWEVPDWRPWALPRPPSNPSETLENRLDRHTAMSRRVGRLGPPPCFDSDPNKLGKLMVDTAVGEVEDRSPTAEERG